MKNQSLEDKFIQEKEKLNELSKKQNKKYSDYSTLRAVIFTAGFIFIAIGIGEGSMLSGVIGGILLIVFLWVVRLHSELASAISSTKNNLLVVERYLSRYGDEWRNFEDNGKEFLEKEDTVAVDIDLLGENSLYQMISVCHTPEGKKRLATLMKLGDIDLSSYTERQEAIEELSQKINFAVAFESEGINFKNKKNKINTGEITAFCKSEACSIIPRWFKVVRIIFPASELIALLLWAVGVINYGLPLVLFLIFLSFTWLTKPVTDGIILPVYGVTFFVDEYIKMLKLIDEEEFDNKYLNVLKEKVSGELGALQAFAKLKTIVAAYNISFNPLIHQVLSGVLLWDYQLAHLVSKWKNKYGGAFSLTFDIVGEMETLLSLSVISMVRKTNKASINFSESDRLSIECEELYHPLLVPDKVVSNSVKLENGITIITGSNMSGKTTFLRTVAINLALAYMGAGICGKKLEAGYMKIFTSMRVVDDVAHGISTFYAEILRIKTMAEYRKKNLPMLCLVDEIFKGTNSADRIVGAKEAITKLSGENCIAVVSTHDFELCSVKDAKGDDATNYHFEEYYENNELKFDYKIKNGRCTTTNARAILRMAGFEVAE